MLPEVLFGPMLLGAVALPLALAAINIPDASASTLAAIGTSNEERSGGPGGYEASRSSSERSRQHLETLEEGGNPAEHIRRRSYETREHAREFTRSVQKRSPEPRGHHHHSKTATAKKVVAAANNAASQQQGPSAPAAPHHESKAQKAGQVIGTVGKVILKFLDFL